MQFYQIINLVISARDLSGCGKVCLPPQSSEALWGLVSKAWNTRNYFYTFFSFPDKCPLWTQAFRVTPRVLGHLKGIFFFKISMMTSKQSRPFWSSSSNILENIFFWHEQRKVEQGICFIYYKNLIFLKSLFFMMGGYFWICKQNKSNNYWFVKASP